MKRFAQLSIVLVLVSLLVSCATVTLAQEEEPSTVFIYKLSQDGQEYQIKPIERAQDAVGFYDYYSSSAHTPYVADNVSRIYLYKNTLTEELSLVIHHAIDEGALDYYRVDFDLEGVPTGAYTAWSDDPDHEWNPSRPGGREFDLTLEPEGNWEHYHNSDGGIISGLPLDQSWSITINPDFIAGIDKWEFVTENSSGTAAVEYINLDMTKPITTSEAPASETGGCFIATAAYGSSLDNHVDTLRSFRDQYLTTDPAGSGLVSAYYKLSPSAARFIENHPALKPIVRVGLLPAVAVSATAIDITFAHKMIIVAVLGVASIGLGIWTRKKVQVRSQAS